MNTPDNPEFFSNDIIEAVWRGNADKDISILHYISLPGKATYLLPSC
jgi:hypothetical protein